MDLMLSGKKTFKITEVQKTVLYYYSLQTFDLTHSLQMNQNHSYAIIYNNNYCFGCCKKISCLRRECFGTFRN